MLTVAWRAPAGAVDHYTVVLNRAVVTTTTATSATLRARRAPVRVAVSATNAAGTGPLSAVATASAAVARPGAPVGLTLAAPDGPRPYAFAPSWKPPDLGGGALVRYEVSWTSARGVTASRTTTGTSLAAVVGDPCAAPYTVSVRAVTRAPGGRLLTGPPTTSTVTARPGTCAVRMTLDAAPDGDDAITVIANDGGGRDGPVRAERGRRDPLVRHLRRPRPHPHRRRRPRPRDHLHRGADRPEPRRHHDPDRPASVTTD